MLRVLKLSHGLLLAYHPLSFVMALKVLVRESALYIWSKMINSLYEVSGGGYEEGATPSQAVNCVLSLL